MPWNTRLTPRDLPDRPPVTMVEAMELGPFVAMGLREDGLDTLLDWRRRARGGQVAGVGTEPIQERLQRR